MIYTNETADSDSRRETFIQAIKDDVKEEGSLNCLLTVMLTIQDLVAEDSMFNVYNNKPLNDAHLVRMFELHDARKQNKPEHTSFYDDSGKEILKLQPQFKTELEGEINGN